MTTLHGALVSLRPARRDDVAELARIRETPEVHRYWRGGDDLVAAVLEDFAEPDTTAYVIELDGRVVGWIQWQAEEEPDYRHASIDIYVEPAVHGRGIGTDAVRTLARHLVDDHGHHRLTIDPAVQNEAAIRAYTKVGFRPVGVERRAERGADGAWHDSLLMDLLAEELAPDEESPGMAAEDFPIRALRLVEEAGFQAVLAGGWSRELLGLEPPRQQSDVDLVVTDANPAELDRWLSTHDEIEAKRSPHKRAFDLDGVMVKLHLVRSGPEYRRHTPTGSPGQWHAYDAGMPGRPDDTPQIIPYLYYEDATKALDFLVEAFGFHVISAFRDDDGDVLTAQLRTGDGVVMIGPGMDGFGTRGVHDPEWATTRMFVYVDDIDAHYERSRAAGARIVSEPAVHFSDNKIYVAADSGGQQWIFAEPVSAAEGGEEQA